MNALFIHHARFAGESGARALLAVDGRIMTVGPSEPMTLPTGAQVVDAQGAILAPGWIDLQLNGGYGFDFTANPDTIWDVAARLPESGVTSFLPTLVTSPLETVERGMRALRRRPEDFLGAEPLGLHIEGPFLNPLKKGAHNPEHLRLPDLAQIDGWTVEAGVRLVTLAPELPGALDLIPALLRRGVTVSAGHSLASYEQALEAFTRGVTSGTHLFNAMPPLSARSPGLAGALLESKGTYFGLIVDGVHVHPALVALALRTRPEGLILVTDAMTALGMPSGEYPLADATVFVDETSARLKDGTLAGSILSMDAAIRNLCAFTGISLEEALPHASALPADLLGLTDRGRLKAGARADLVLLDESVRVLKTWVGGELVHTCDG